MKYRKKPVLVDAYQFAPLVGPDDRPKWLLDAMRMGVVDFFLRPEPHLTVYGIGSRERAYPGDWIIKDDKGGLQVCKPNTFEATYEPAEPATP